MCLRRGQGGSGNRQRAEQVIAPYPAGARVRVSFDPRHPADAVLRRGIHWNNAAIALCAIAFLWSGYAILMHAR
jgi:hypothetical protein